MTITTRLTQRFGLEHPILSAPMAGAAGGRLAAAVCEAGGLGLIGGAHGQWDWLEAEFAEAGDMPVGCGFITWSLEASPQVLDRVLERRPSAILLSFGDPAHLGRRVRDAGVPLLCQVHNRADAVEAVAAGADVVVAQGTEAGGHGDHSRTTFTLVPEVADLLAREAPDTLLCAAGGVADGRGLAAALMLGADGVMIGSRLWATVEAKVGSRMHEVAIGSDGDSTVLTRAPDIARQDPWPSRFTVRVIRNRFTDEWEGRDDELRQTAGAVGEHWVRAYIEGDPEGSNTVVGEAVGLINQVESAGDVIRRMVAEAALLLGSRNGALGSE
jgi:nitronate monooxygenase